jgi:hypothetical protein
VQIGAETELAGRVVAEQGNICGSRLRSIGHYEGPACGCTAGQLRPT